MMDCGALVLSRTEPGTGTVQPIPGPQPAASARLETFAALLRYLEAAPKSRRFVVTQATDSRIDLRMGAELLILVAAGRIGIRELDAVIERVGQPGPSGGGPGSGAMLVLVGDEASLTGVESLRDRGVMVPLGLPVSPERLVVELRNAAELIALRRTADERARWVDRYRYEIGELIEIARAIGSERDVRKLLALILEKCRQITGADAGSLYILESDGRHVDVTQQRLRFILSQNDSLQIDFREFTLPVDAKSIVGASVLARRPINIRDLYRLDQDTNPWGFRHDKSFDTKTGYQTRSILTVPMFNHSDEVIGVVQLINKKADSQVRLKSDEDFGVLVVPFDQRSEELARSLASQAGISLENAMLYDEMKRVFEGFVKASVTAIESRDPTTSGHSQRVAELTVGLAKTVDNIHDGEFAAINYSPDDLTEIEYAALLHDFGKVGVREHVLVKAKKLYEHQREILEWRFEYIRKLAQVDEMRRKLETVMERTREESLDRFGVIEQETRDRLKAVDEYLAFILKANEPTVLAEGGFERLIEIASNKFLDPRGAEAPFLCEAEVQALRIPRGSLTEDERKEIESHVVHTYNFLRRIPWGRAFKDIPEIAGAHHEKLDGTGYPRRLTAVAIPVPARMMTISDIYDALTASDRAYKKAMGVDKALDILRMEVKDGKCDPDLFDTFVAAKIYDIVAR
jgi:HD-GYP domain-containing protein (c-di-GMP phosphodiesterase class II)